MPDARGYAPVEAEFFDKPVLLLARALIGKLLVHETSDGVAGGRIVETEAYRGPADLAAHSSRGCRTKRTEAMFGAAGHAYIFLLYGVSWAFNVVAGEIDAPHAVLVRAIEPTIGVDLMAARRNKPPGSRELTNGPGKLCSALGIDKLLYGEPLTGPRLFVARPDPPPSRAPRVGRSARINIDYAGAWVSRPWRFYERGNRYVSVPPRD